MWPARQPGSKPEPTAPAREGPRLVSPDAELAARGREADAYASRHLRVALSLANFIGAVLVFIFLYWVVPAPTGSDELGRVNTIVFIVALSIAMPLGAYLSLRVARTHREWLRSGRPWDEHHRQLVLRYPLRQAKVEGVLWGSSALLFGAINATDSVALGIEVAVSILLAGLATAALCYLMTERALRPVTALALASGTPSRPAVPGVAVRMVLAWAFGTGIAILGAGLVAAAFLATEDTSPRRLAATILFLTVIALVAGLATLLIAARSIADPIESVRTAMAEVEAGNVSAEVPVYDGSEVGLLQAGFNRMAAGLRERDRIRDLFGRHVGEDVARDALARGIRLGGEVREAAVLFVDLIGSTALAANRDPTSVLATLNRFFDIVVEVVTAHGGWVNKFEGDAALCAFGAPTPHPDAATAALAAGRELCSRLGGELDEVEAAVGLSAGEVVAGNVGAARRFEYTVIGDPVNEAARLTELAKAAPSRLLASEAILRRATDSERSRWQLGDSVVLRGRPEPTRIATPA